MLTDQFQVLDDRDLDRRFTLAAGMIELGITSVDELDVLSDSIGGSEVRRWAGFTYACGAARRLDDHCSSRSASATSG